MENDDWKEGKRLDGRSHSSNSPNEEVGNMPEEQWKGVWGYIYSWYERRAALQHHHRHHHHASRVPSRVEMAPMVAE